MAENRNRDATAEFVRLMGESERRLRAFVLCMVPHWADADEIMQPTRVRIWEQFDEYDPNKDFGAWARTIAYYLVLAQREKQSRLPKLQSQGFLESVARQFDEASPEVESRERALRVCLQEQNDAARRLLRHFYSRGESLAEIAAGVNISANAVKKRLARTRAALAKCIAKRMALEGEK